MTLLRCLHDGPYDHGMKPGEPRGGQEGILLSPSTPPPVTTHTGRAMGRGGGKEGASRTASGGDEESSPVC